MARRLRIQFPGARYHVINRGNLRHDIFATAGARRSFTGVTGRTGDGVRPKRATWETCRAELLQVSA